MVQDRVQGVQRSRRKETGNGEKGFRTRLNGFSDRGAKNKQGDEVKGKGRKGFRTGFHGFNVRTAKNR